MGVPVVLGKNGVEKIVELDISTEERASLHNSAKEVRQGIDELKQVGIL